MATRIDMAKFAKFCKDMGFIFQSSEIYGGINGFWDYGPLGVELKRNIKEAWWQDMVRNPPPGPDGQEIRMVGLDCSIIMNPKVWVASGHVGGFSDPMVDCKICRKRYRADKVQILKVYALWSYKDDQVDLGPERSEPVFFSVLSDQDDAQATVDKHRLITSKKIRQRVRERFAGLLRENGFTDEDVRQKADLLELNTHIDSFP